MNYQSPLSISADTNVLLSSAATLADALKLPLLPLDEKHPQLVVTEHRIEIRAADLGGPAFIDFTSGRNAYRREFGGTLSQQPLAKAIGSKNAVPTVIDATAGFARDAFVLANLGCQVVLIERNPLMAALIDDALQRARNNHAISDVIQRMSLVKSDAIDYLTNLVKQQWADVIYLDPMYPARAKSALVKKEMRLLRKLAGKDDDSGTLLATARQTALKKVVVKRPQSAPFIDGKAPSASIKSKNTRYDIYPTIKQKHTIPTN